MPARICQFPVPPRPADLPQVTEPERATDGLEQLIEAVLKGPAREVRLQLETLAADLPQRKRRRFNELLYRSVSEYPMHMEAIRHVLRRTGWLTWNRRRSRSWFWTKRCTAAWVLGDIGDSSETENLVRLLHDRREEVRVIAAYSLAQVGDEFGLKAVVQAASQGRLKDAEELSLVLALAAYRALELVLPLLSDPNRFVQLAALNALLSSGKREAAQNITAMLSSPYPEVRAMAAQGLGQLRYGKAVGGLRELLGDTDWNVKSCAAWALKELKSAGGRLNRRSG